MDLRLTGIAYINPILTILDVKKALKNAAFFHSGVSYAVKHMKRVYLRRSSK